MEISNEDFVRLIVKAVNITDSLTQIIAGKLGVDVSTLKEWAEGQNVPPVEQREDTLRSVMTVMIEALNSVVNIGEPVEGEE